MEIQSLIDAGAEVLRDIFDRHGLEQVPVNEKNVANAVTALPAVKEEVVKAFEGFDGFDNTDGKKKKKKIDSGKVANALAVAGAVAGTVAALKKGGAAKNDTPPEAEPKKETPTVFGFNAYLFWSVIVIVILIIILYAVKALRK